MTTPPPPPPSTSESPPEGGDSARFTIMLNENVPDDTTPPPFRARLPRGFGSISPIAVLDAAMIVHPVTMPTWEAAKVTADDINVARQHHGRHGEETALVEVGALVTVRLAASGAFRPPRPGDPVLHTPTGHYPLDEAAEIKAKLDKAFDLDEGSVCPKCDHPTEMHGSTGCRVRGGSHGYACGCMEWWKHH